MTSPLPRRILAELATDASTLAFAESLTGGLLADAFIQVPGASTVVRGAVVAYATDLKHTLLGVDDALLSRVGAVDPDVVRAMASGVAERLGADLGLATTGVAGPDPQDGKRVGTVYVAVAGTWAGKEFVKVRGHLLSGDRVAIRAQAVQAAVAILAEVVGVREQDGQ